MRENTRAPRVCRVSSVGGAPRASSRGAVRDDARVSGTLRVSRVRTYDVYVQLFEVI